ncbi:FTR1 family iron permease [Lentibacillus sp. Marseille-P4043]|uniref:FTR1 family iron permease n=1 Tax=Lentibacillus sp. Marseille-P4043 TaxID=2040293 RepID=UPI000D0B4FBD|nr:FTR1 family protein [Lentibacillus sp. Marseille-P4043]
MHKAKKGAFLISMAILFSMFSNVTVFAANDKVNFDELYIEIGDGMMHARDEEWMSVKDNITAFQNLWNQMNETDSESANQVTTNLDKVMDAINTPDKNSTQIKKLLSSLSKSLAKYDKELNPVDQAQERKKVSQLLPLIDDVAEKVNAGNFDQASTSYQQFFTNWTSKEIIVRNQSVTAYGEIETQLAFLRISLSQTPPDKQKALTSIQDLRTAIQNFVDGKVTKKATEDNHSLDDAVQLLNNAAQSIEANNPEKASEHLNKMLLIWPVVEGSVRTRDPKLYSEIENNVPKAISLLQSEKKDTTKANAIITDLGDRLKLIAGETEYSFVDAMLILLREGLEAILIIAGLIAFLKKTNNEKKQGWIWSGAFVGLLASAGLAVCINIFFSNMTAAASREYLEGIIGLVAVVMMLTVGAWLHKKTNVSHWNHYIKQTMSNAAAKGSLFSMAVLSFLSIFREGAETIIFYAGMAPSMDISQLVLGIGIAFVLLLVLGFAIIRYSAKIPLRPFFFVATWLIYFLAFKMLGVSVHALQVANIAPVHYIQHLPFIEFIGLYPTIETLLPQVLLLLVILGTSFYVKKSANFKSAVTH